MEYYSAIEKNKLMPFETTWIQLEILILSEVSQKEKDKYDITYVWNLKHGTNEPVHRNRLRHGEQTCGCKREGEDGGRWRQRWSEIEAGRWGTRGRGDGDRKMMGQERRGEDPPQASRRVGDLPAYSSGSQTGLGSRIAVALA